MRKSQIIWIAGFLTLMAAKTGTLSTAHAASRATGPKLQIVWEPTATGYTAAIFGLPECKGNPTAHNSADVAAVVLNCGK